MFFIVQISDPNEFQDEQIATIKLQYYIGYGHSLKDTDIDIYVIKHRNGQLM